MIKNVLQNDFEYDKSDFNHFKINSKHALEKIIAILKCSKSRCSRFEFFAQINVLITKSKYSPTFSYLVLT